MEYTHPNKVATSLRQLHGSLVIASKLCLCDANMHRSEESIPRIIDLVRWVPSIRITRQVVKDGRSVLSYQAIDGSWEERSAQERFLQGEYSRIGLKSIGCVALRIATLMQVYRINMVVCKQMESAVILRLEDPFRALGLSNVFSFNGKNGS